MHIIKDVEHTLTSVECNNMPEGQINSIRNMAINQISNFQNKNKFQNNKVLNSLDRLINKDAICTKKWIAEHGDVVIVKSDKSNKTIIIDKPSYLQKMEKLFEDKSKYRILRNDPTEDFKSEYHKFLNTLVNKKYISKKEKTSLTSHGACPPRTYGLIKLHKEGLPCRNIVSNIGSITEKLSKVLNKSLDPLCRNNGYDVQNSFEVMTRLNQCKLEVGHVMVSFDVKSMFPNIPLTATYKILREHWEEIEPHTFIKDKNMFIEGLKICNKQYFLFNDNIYRQLDGISMGGSLSVNLSGIFMNNLIDKAMSQSQVKPVLLMKYVDDILCIMKEDEVERFLLTLNSIHPNIKFTVEMEVNQNISFLDLSICRNGISDFKYRWYCKPTSSGRMLNFYSNHPYSQRLNVLTNFIIRALRLSHLDFWDELKTVIFQRLLDNGYPIKLIKKVWHRECGVISNSHKYKCWHKFEHSPDGPRQNGRNNKNETCSYVSFTFRKGISENLGKMFNEQGLNNTKFGYKGTNKISKMYPPLKDKLDPKYSNNVIYKINCNDCNEFYIGQSKNLGNRLQQHKDDIKHLSARTALCAHSVNKDHRINFKDVKILDREENRRKREHLESLYILKHSEQTMNFKTDIGTKGLLYANVINML